MNTEWYKQTFKEDSDGYDILSTLNTLSNKYNVKWSEGEIKEIRLSTEYEAFEFSPTIRKDGNLGVNLLLHFPNYTNSVHRQFRLERYLLGIKDIYKYVYWHSRNIYTKKRKMPHDVSKLLHVIYVHNKIKKK